MPKAKEWSIKEIAILKQIHGSGIATRYQVHLLPGRTFESIKQTMATQGWGRKPRGKELKRRPYTKRKGKTNFLRFIETVRNHGPITSADAAKKMNLDKNTVYAMCKFAHRGGPEKLIYVAAFTEAGVDSTYARRKYAIGNLPDMVSESWKVRERKRQQELAQERDFARVYAPRREPLIEAFFGVAA